MTRFVTGQHWKTWLTFSQNLTWFFDKADGSLTREGEVLFWTGIESAEEVKDLMTDFAKHGRKLFGDINLESKLQKAAQSTQTHRHVAQHARAYSTVGHLSNPVRPCYQSPSRAQKTMPKSNRRQYATTTNPNPPLGKKNASNSEPAKVALIGMLCNQVRCNICSRS